MKLLHKDQYAHLTQQARKLECQNLQHEDSRSKSPDSHATAPNGVIGEVDRRPAAIADVPGHWTRMRWVVVVGAHLAVDADGVHDGQAEAEEEREDWCPYTHDEGHQLDEEHEERQNRNADIVVRKT